MCTLGGMVTTGENVFDNDVRMYCMWEYEGFDDHIQTDEI